MTDQHTTGYCPACGRGDVAPTAEEYEQQRQRAEHAEAELQRLRAGEEDGWDPAAYPTPGQWIARFNRATPAERHDAAKWAIENSQRASQCVLNAHEQRLNQERHAWVALARVKDVIADMSNITDARHWARILRTAVDGEEQPRTTANNAPTSTDTEAEAVRQMDADPHTGLVVQPYREHGQEKWVFRCWDEGDGCDGLVSLDHTSREWAERARDRHIAEQHQEQP
ncbi:hypothetical protein [Streptomyces sp. NPDC001139]